MRKLVQQLRSITIRDAGVPLAPEVQARMARSFGFDFSGVRLYRWERSSQAVCFGRNVFLGDDVFDLDTKPALHLMTHECAHVVQQREGGEPAWISSPGDQWEKAADSNRFLEPAPLGVYFGSIPRPQPQVTFDSLVGSLSQSEPNRLAMVYLAVIRQNAPNSLNFLQAAEQSLVNRISALYMTVLQRLAALHPQPNRPSMAMLISRSAAQINRYQSGAAVPPGAIVWPAAIPVAGPSISAATGGGRALTPRETRISRGLPAGDPLADNLADYSGRPPAYQTLTAIEHAGPIGALGALIATCRGADDDTIQRAVAAGSLGDVAISGGAGIPNPQNTQGMDAQNAFRPPDATERLDGPGRAGANPLRTDGSIRRHYTRDHFGLTDH